MGVDVPDPAKYTETGMKMRRNQLLIFSRWCQVMLRFEKGMYADPQQDLNKLWWDLVEKYQLLKRPTGRDEPDFASKIHIVSAPAYYHNYMMGQLFACQVHHAIAREVLKADNPARAFYTDNKEVGEFMRNARLRPGPQPELERADEARHRRRAESASLRRRVWREVGGRTYPPVCCDRAELSPS